MSAALNNGSNNGKSLGGFAVDDDGCGRRHSHGLRRWRANADPTDPNSTAGITINLSSTSLTIVQGQSGSVSLSISRPSSFKGTLELALAAAPDGMTATFNPASLPEGTSFTNVSPSFSPQGDWIVFEADRVPKKIPTVVDTTRAHVPTQRGRRAFASFTSTVYSGSTSWMIGARTVCDTN